MFHQTELFDESALLPQASEDLENLLSLEALRDAEFAITDEDDGRQTWIRRAPKQFTPAWVKRNQQGLGFAKELR
jgi:hypothetical protein